MIHERAARVKADVTGLVLLVPRALTCVGDQHAAAAEDAGLLEAEVENSSQPLAKASIEASALRQLRELRSADRLLDPSVASRGWRSPRSAI